MKKKILGIAFGAALMFGLAFSLTPEMAEANVGGGVTCWLTAPNDPAGGTVCTINEGEHASRKKACGTLGQNRCYADTSRHCDVNVFCDD